LIALYLDEDIPPLAARLLRTEGYDVVSAYDAGMVQKEDEDHLQYAATNHRTIVTFNQRHFAPLYEHWWFGGREHHGIVLSREYKLDEVGELVRRLRNLVVRNNPGDLTNHLVYLQQYQ
jgi:hypothetical protein